MELVEDSSKEEEPIDSYTIKDEVVESVEGNASNVNDFLVSVKPEYIIYATATKVSDTTEESIPEVKDSLNNSNAKSNKRPREGKIDPSERLCQSISRGENCERDDTEGGVIPRQSINVLNKLLQKALRKKNYNPPAAIASAGGPPSLPPPGDLKEDAVSTFNSTPYPAAETKRKLVDFSNKVYIAPLTTVGNLPFRRIMKDFGADITCGEMAMAQNLIEGQASEWALIRRHASEDIFGMQLAGSHPELMGRLCKVLDNETSSDFVDLNCGCPIDLVCNRLCGAALMNRPKRLLEVVAAMGKHLTTRSVTVKMRVGWDVKTPNAHKIVSELQKLSKGRLAAIMIHGRSRLQRYTKLANWEYVLEAARSQDPTLPVVPVIGNGDIISWQDWAEHRHLLRDSVDESPEQMGLCSCAMIGRGALLKPWLPTEVKDSRHWDISASERLDMLKTFVNYGLEHWGSDQQGVNTTRRFLLEWMSFLCRYVPVGIIEHLPQRINQRPPLFRGRNDLETLLGSADSKDWIEVSKMLLGPLPEGFHFAAKHKSNSYAVESSEMSEVQG